MNSFYGTKTSSVIKFEPHGPWDSVGAHFIQLPLHDALLGTHGTKLQSGGNEGDRKDPTIEPPYQIPIKTALMSMELPPGIPGRRIALLQLLQQLVPE